MNRPRINVADSEDRSPGTRPLAATTAQPTLFGPSDSGRQAESEPSRHCTASTRRPFPRYSASGLSLEETLDSCSHLLTVRELASLLSIAEKTIYGYVSRGLIPYVKIQSNIRFRPRAIVRWLAQREFDAPLRGRGKAHKLSE